MDNAPNAILPAYYPYSMTTLPQSYSFAADALEDLAVLMKEEGNGLNGPQMSYFDRIIVLYRKLGRMQ